MTAAISAKLASILSIVVTPAPGPEETFGRLAHDFDLHLLNLTGDSHRDIEHLQYETEDNAAWFAGSGGGVRRLVLVVEIRSIGTAHLILRATKGNVDIANIEWGDTGPEIGNSLLIMRLLHVGICSFRSLGFQRLTNDPWNDRLRMLYASFGFKAGEALDLNDSAALTAALTIIARTYGRFGIDLSGPPS
jgi:hypothetical protein